MNVGLVLVVAFISFCVGILAGVAADGWPKE